jgi:hypothetical protein
MALGLVSGLTGLFLGPLGIFLWLFIFVIVGSIIILIVGALVFFIPAAVIAYVVWWLTGDHTLAGIAFLVIAILSLFRHK